MGTSVEYQQAHADDDIGKTIIAVNCSMLMLAYIATALRFYSRRLIGAPMKADDWMLTAAVVLATGHITGEIVAVRYGFGKHTIFVQDPAFFAKILLSAETLYNFAIPAIKFSILLLYRRLFPKKSFHRHLWTVAAFVCCYSLTQMLTFLLQCVPIESIWNPTIDGRCIDIGTVLIVMSALNVITDVAILCLPIPMVWSLDISAARRLQLIGLFLLGSLVCVISIVRATYVSKVSTTDPSWDDAEAGIWSTIEICVAIISACLPTLRPLYKVLRRGTLVSSSLNDPPSHHSHALDYGKSQTLFKPASKASTSVKSWVSGGDSRMEAGRFKRLEERDADGAWEMQGVQVKKPDVGSRGKVHEMDSPTPPEK